MPKKAALPPPLAPKVLTLHGVASYLGLGSPQAAERWLRAHGVKSFLDRLGRRRAWVREIDAACFALTAEQFDQSRKVADVEDETRRRA